VDFIEWLVLGGLIIEVVLALFYGVFQRLLRTTGPRIQDSKTFLVLACGWSRGRRILYPKCGLQMSRDGVCSVQ
jgi:hypothetical protein